MEMPAYFLYTEENRVDQYFQMNRILSAVAVEGIIFNQREGERQYYGVRT
jgi:hypothetical protein